MNVTISREVSDQNKILQKATSTRDLYDQDITDNPDFKQQHYEQCMKLFQKYEKRRLNILVANDNSFQLLLASNIMKKVPNIGHIELANNGQEALEKIKKSEFSHKSSFDLILLDLDMPILNGYDACRQILKYYQFLDKETIPFQPKEDRMENLNRMQDEYVMSTIDQRSFWFKDLSTMIQIH